MNDQPIFKLVKNKTIKTIISFTSCFLILSLKINNYEYFYYYLLVVILLSGLTEFLSYFLILFCEIIPSL